jgi:hypothetical protein
MTCPIGESHLSPQLFGNVELFNSVSNLDTTVVDRWFPFQSYGLTLQVFDYESRRRARTIWERKRTGHEILAY